MPLTPADVHNVAFKKPSIGKRGYDEDEVDAFLDVVEAELSRLIEENNTLTSQLADGSGTAAPSVQKAAPAPTGDVSTQAARILALAQQTADQLTDEAKADSEKVLADAKSQSEALLSDATTRAEATDRESRTKAEALEAEAKAKYDEVLGKLAGERVGLEKKIADLRSYEREYRGRLKSWISEQLAQLDGESTKEQAAPVLTGPGE
jgi:DivIVA domain-containing protein